MNRKSIVLFTGVLAGLCLFEILFWQQAAGLNYLLFTGWLLAGWYLLYPQQFLRREVKWVAAAVLYCAICVVLADTGIALAAAITSLVILAAMVHAPKLKSVHSLLFYAVIQACTGLFAAPQKIDDEKINYPGRSGVWFWMKLSASALTVLLLFTGMYSVGSYHFNENVGIHVDQTLKDILHFFRFISIEHFWFFILGLIILWGGFTVSKLTLVFRTLEDRVSETMRRKPKQGKLKPLFHFKNTALEKERLQAIVLFGLLNLLTLACNIIDVRWVWLYWPQHPDSSLKEFVHEGTQMLLFSIAVASGLILYYYRQNQNFYKGSRWMGILAKAWLLQNIFLALSALLRTAHYILYHGLAYGRLALLFFIALTIAGLIFLLIKISEQKTFYYLMQRTGWAAFALLLLACPADWDRVIVSYNLHHGNPAGIDTDLYLDMPDACMPELIKDSSLIKYQLIAHKNSNEMWISNYDYEHQVKYRILSQKDDFIKRYRAAGWPAWNLRDLMTFRALEKINSVRPH